MANPEHERHEGAANAVDKAQDAIGGAVGMTSAKTMGSHSAKAFVDNAAQSNRYEIEAAEIALSRSPSEPVRTLARQMIDDHRALGERLRGQAAAAGLQDEAAAELDQRRQGMLDNLRTAPDGEFDRRYLDQQEMAHREAVALFEGFAEHGDNAEMQSAAQEAVGVLREHLEMVRQAKGH
jgi:putative membrane protein